MACPSSRVKANLGACFSIGTSPKILHARQEKPNVLAPWATLGCKLIAQVIKTHNALPKVGNIASVMPSCSLECRIWPGNYVEWGALKTSYALDSLSKSSQILVKATTH